MEHDSTDTTSAGIDRRSLLKRGAVVGGALVWTTPIVQTIASPAFAQTSPVVIVGCPPGATTFTSAAKFEGFEGTNRPIIGTRVPLPPEDNKGTCFETSGIEAGTTPEAPDDAFVSVVETSPTTLQVTLKAGFTLLNGFTLSAGVKAGQDCFMGVVTGVGPTFTVTISSGDISNVVLVISGPCE